MLPPRYASLTNENWKLASEVNEELCCGIPLSPKPLETAGTCLCNTKAIQKSGGANQTRPPDTLERCIDAERAEERARKHRTRGSSQHHSDKHDTPHQDPTHCVSDLGHVTLKQRGQIDDPLLCSKVVPTSPWVGAPPISSRVGACRCLGRCPPVLGSVPSRLPFVPAVLRVGAKGGYPLLAHHCQVL